MRFNNTDVERSLNKLSKKINEIEIDELKDDLRSIYTQLSEAISDLEDEADELDEEVEELKEEIKDLKNDLSICNKQSDTRRNLGYSEQELNRMLLEIWQNRIRFAYDPEKMKMIEEISRM